MSLLLEIVGWIFATYLIISCVEHLTHRFMMHNKSFVSKKFPKFEWIYTDHAVLHHGKYYKVFNYEPDDHGRELNLRLIIIHNVLFFFPLLVAIFCVSRVGGCVMFVMMVVHHLLWNLIHVEMHIPSKTWLSNNAVYKWLARYHYLHHRYPTKNFNIVFPFADYVFGTNASAKEVDLTKMQELGYSK